jgi:hypothetical protein
MESVSTNINPPTVADKAMIAGLCLLLASYEDFMYDQMYQWRDISDWLLKEERNILVDIYQQYPRGQSGVTYFPHLLAPDICVSCYTIYGETFGGRLRKGCYQCGKEADYPIRNFYAIRDMFYISTAHMEYLFSKALAIWAKGKEQGNIP